MGNTFEALEDALLFVKDLKTSAQWYQDFLEKTPSEQSENFARFQINNNALILHPADVKSPASAGGGVSYWRVQNLSAVITKATKLGAIVYRGPLKLKGDTFICQILDPYGNVFGLKGKM